MERASEDDQTQIRENVPPVDRVPPTSPSASVHEPAPPLAGHENKKEVLLEQIITPDGMFKRPLSGGIYGSLKVLKQPIITRLEELTSMDPTVDVGTEIADSVYLLNLINSANPEMQRAGLQAGRGAKQLQEAAHSVIHSQQILRSALPNKDNIVNTPPNPTHSSTRKYFHEEQFGHENKKEEVLWEQIITPNGMFKRPLSGGIYGSLKVLMQPIIARLEELTSMDPTVDVGTEIADSVYLLNLINSTNPEMQRAGLQAARGAKQLQEAARSVIHSQQILRSVLLNKDNIVNTPPNSTLSLERKYSDEGADLVKAYKAYNLIHCPVCPPISRGPFGETSDFEPFVNQGIYSSVKSKVASGSKGTKSQSSSASGQVPLQTEKQNH